MITGAVGFACFSWLSAAVLLGSGGTVSAAERRGGPDGATTASALAAGDEQLDRLPTVSPRPGIASVLAPASASALDTAEILWSWTFTPAPSWDNVVSVHGGPDIDGDGWPDALVASEDRTLRAFSGHSRVTPALLWTFGGTDEIPVSDRSIALYPDRDGDGKPEILWSTGYADRSVYLIRSSNGIPFWSYDLRQTGCTLNAWIHRAVPLADINRDGTMDVAVAAGSQCNKVFTLSGADGSLIWQYTGLDGVRAVVDAGDMTGDRFHDVLAAAGANFNETRMFLLSGKPTAPSRLVWQRFAGSFVSSATTIHDFTGDGVDEAVGGSWDRSVFAVSGASVGTVTSNLWSTSVVGGTGWVEHVVTIPDIDGDCVDDVAVSSWTPTTRIVSGRTGATIWERTVGSSSNAAYGALVPDLTGDLQWDWVVGGLNTGWVTLFSGADGTKIWEWGAPRNVRAVGWIGDISEDGLPDILVGLQDASTAHAFAGRTAAAGCVRPAGEVTGVMVERLDGGRLRLRWTASTDACHDRYRIYGVPESVRSVRGCFAALVDLTALDEDGDPANTSWTGPGAQFGYLVIDEAANGGRGPLGHFRR